MIELNLLGTTVYIDGNEKKEPVWFLHGLGDTSQTWNELFDDLKSHFHLFSIDLPGHGTSADISDTSPKEIEDIILWFKKVIDTTTEMKPFFLVGHSWGAEIALRFAILFPDLVKGIILLDGGYIQNEDVNATVESDLKQVNEFYQSYHFSNWDKFIENEKTYYKRWSDKVQQAALFKMKQDINNQISQKVTLSISEAVMRSLHTYPSKEIYSKVTCPILLLKSSLPESSYLMKEKAAKRLVLSTPNTLVETIPNAGHNIQVDAPRVVANKINEWIEHLE